MRNYTIPKKFGTYYISSFKLSLLLILISINFIPGNTWAQGDLFVAVYSTNSHVLPGSTYSYRINISNRGPENMENVVVKFSTDAHFTATGISCIDGLSNEGSSDCGTINAGSLAAILNTTTGLVIPSIPDGGTVNVFIEGDVANVANFQKIIATASVEADGSGPSDNVPGNNEHSFTTVIHDLQGVTESEYELNAFRTRDSSGAFSPNGGTLRLIFELISGPPVPGIGETFEVPLTYSALMPRNTTANHSWHYVGPSYWQGPAAPDEWSFALTVSNEIFNDLPPQNTALLLTEAYSDHFFRQQLSTGTLLPTGTYTLQIGALPTLPPETISKVEDFFFINGMQGTASTEAKWAVYTTPIWEPVSLPEEAWLITNTPFNSEATFRYLSYLFFDEETPDIENTNNYLWGDFWGSVTLLTSNTVLPVNLSSFTVEGRTQGVLLKWATSNELNNKGFQIQRSDDGKQWMNIGFVGAKSANNSGSSYEFIDENPLPKYNYYRLQQEDYDGKTTYSQVVSVNFNRQQPSIVISPNPAQSFIHVKNIPANSRVQVFSADGKQVYNAQNVHQAELTISLENYPAGNYFIRINDMRSINITRKLVKQ